MSENRLNHLRRRHVRLEAEIVKEARRLLPDQLRLARMKKLNLALKDEIAQIGRAGRKQAA